MQREYDDRVCDYQEIKGLKSYIICSDKILDKKVRTYWVSTSPNQNHYDISKMKWP
jgi:hypothetical protein